MKPCCSSCVIFNRLPLGKLLFTILSLGIAMMWMSPHLSQLSQLLVERLLPFRNESIKSVGLFGCRPTNITYYIIYTKCWMQINLPTNGNGSHDLDSRALFNHPKLLCGSSELDAMLDRMRLGRGFWRPSSGASIIWLPKAVLMVSLDPPGSGTCKLFRLTFRKWRACTTGL